MSIMEAMQDEIRSAVKELQKDRIPAENVKVVSVDDIVSKNTTKEEDNKDEC